MSLVLMCWVVALPLRDAFLGILGRDARIHPAAMSGFRIVVVRQPPCRSCMLGRGGGLLCLLVAIPLLGRRLHGERRRGRTRGQVRVVGT